MRTRRGAALVVAAVATAMFATAAPSSATVHEITGMLCSLQRGDGGAILAPPGISGENGESERAEANLALPLFATGFATFVPGAAPGGGDLIMLDEDHPASKISLTGDLLPVGDGLYVTDFEFDRGAWQHCLRP